MFGALESCHSPWITLPLSEGLLKASHDYVSADWLPLFVVYL